VRDGAFDARGGLGALGLGAGTLAVSTMTPEILGGGRGTLAPMMASVTFGGPDLKTVYLGSLTGARLPSFRSPVAGLPLTHWHG
jgi:gluconolactonase